MKIQGAFLVVGLLLGMVILTPVTSAADKNYRIYFGSGSTELWQHENLTWDMNHSVGAIGDANGDGVMDILVVDMSYSNFTVFSGNSGDVIWQRLNVRTNTTSIIYNITGNSCLDVFVGYNPGSLNVTKFELWKGTDGKALWSKDIGFKYENYSIITGDTIPRGSDYNNDDFPDLTLYSYFSNSTVFKYELAAIDGRTGDILWKSNKTVNISYDYLDQSGSVVCTAVDLNSNSINDIVFIAGNMTLSEIAVYDGNTGSLMYSRILPSVYMPSQISDCTGDGVADFVISTGGGITVINGTNGNPVLFRSSESIAVSLPDPSRITDFSGDGVSDLVVMQGDIMSSNLTIVNPVTNKSLWKIPIPSSEMYFLDLWNDVNSDNTPELFVYSMNYTSTPMKQSIFLLNGKTGTQIWMKDCTYYDFFFWTLIYSGSYNTDLSGDSYPDIAGVSLNKSITSGKIEYEVLAYNGMNGKTLWKHNINQSISGYDGGGGSIYAMPTGDMDNNGHIEVCLSSHFTTTDGLRGHEESIILSGIDGMKIWNVTAEIESTYNPSIGLAIEGPLFPEIMPFSKDLMDFNKDGKSNDALVITSKGLYVHTLENIVPEYFSPTIPIILASTIAATIVLAKSPSVRRKRLL